MMIAHKCKVCGLNVEMVATPLEMPWGSIYWLLEARLERPILPRIFRYIGEPNWAALEPTQDAATQKLQESIESDLAGYT